MNTDRQPIPVERLPHPVRISAANPRFLPNLEANLKPEWARIQQQLKAPGLALPEIIRRLGEPGVAPRLVSFMDAAYGMPGGTEAGATLGIMAFLRQHWSPAPHFVLDDDLVQMLENTDIAPDVPMSMFNLPFPRLYVELGRRRDIQTTIANELSGDHVLEGAYIEQGQHIEGELIYIVLTGSPLGKSGPEDDATMSVALPLVAPGAENDHSIAEVIRAGQERALRDARSAGVRVQPTEWLDQTVRAILLLVKALLYIGLPGTRREMHPERTQALKELAGLKSAGKKAKALRRAERVYDFIRIGPQPEHVSPSEPGVGDRSVKAHWRRGHYRMQAHGAQMALRKLIFIQPVLVSGQGVAVDAPALYKVS